MTLTPTHLVVNRLTDAGCGPKKNGKGWAARCPAHDDRDPSLSVDEGDDNQALICCHAGCDIDLILQKLNLTRADLFERRNGTSDHTIVATYRYVDENQHLLFEVVRYQPKDFRQRRPDGNGGWIWKLGDTRRVLYRLPRVVDAIAVGDPIFVVEGEKDVHAVEAAGETATCNPAGAGKWRDEYSAQLTGADVIIVADRDKTGRDHALAVAAALRPVAASIRLCEAAEGKDVTDHLAAGHSLEELALLDVDSDIDDSQTTDELRLRVWTPAELVDALQPFSWLVRSMLTAPTYGMCGGLKKTLKSYVTAAVVVAVASGEPLFGRFEVPTARPALVFVGEGGRDPYTRRMRRIAASFGVRFEDLPIFTVVEPADVNSVKFRGTLEDELAERQPGLVLLDPWYAYHGAERNASNLFEEGALLTSLSAPCIDAGATLLVNNHFNKTGSGRGLDRITQAGGQEWSDSWLLLAHREEPDVDIGSFRLILEIGSRQWGGATWDLDIELGRFDEELGEFDGDLTWTINTHAEADGTAGRTAKARDLILDIVADMPWAFTKTEVRDRVKGDRGAFDAAWDELHDGQDIVAERLPHAEGTRTVTRDLWAPAGTLRPGNPTGTDDTVRVASEMAFD